MDLSKFSDRTEIKAVEREVRANRQNLKKQSFYLTVEVLVAVLHFVYEMNRAKL
jgi:hypothetical protein